jgi:hypothetical protein
MQLWRFIKCMFCVTVVALIYIHMQMNIFSLAYDGKQKEQHLARLMEQNGRVLNNIFELKSANHIGRTMLTREAGFKFYDGKNVVQIAAARPEPDQEQSIERVDGKINGVLRFLTSRFPREAQAKEDQAVKPWQRRR